MNDNEMKRALEMREDEIMELCGEIDGLKEENEALRKYAVRGGFIKDKNGRLCKDGDKIRFEAPNGREFISVLNYDAYAFWVDAEHKNYLVCELSNWFELVEPCEPDVCKNFKGDRK